MSQGDWVELSGGLSSGSVDRGVTTGIARPSGGGGYVFGFNSLDVTPGCVGFGCSLTNFAPLAKGGSIRGAIQRGVSGGPLNFTPMLFLGLQGTAVTDHGYILGLQDDDPHRIVLRKGALDEGIPAGASGNGILARSTATYAPGTWLHLRLDVIVNPSGDVLLQCFANALGAHPVTAPTWVAIPGLANFVDDALGINTGSSPFGGGRAGWAFASKDVTRRGFLDQIELLRQL